MFFNSGMEKCVIFIDYIDMVLVPFTLGFALIRAKTTVTKFTLLKSGGGKCKI